jgi:hypothetical protein
VQDTRAERAGVDRRRRPLSDEHKACISATKRARWQDTTFRRKMAVAHAQAKARRAGQPRNRRPHSALTRQRIAQAATGRTLSKAARKLLAEKASLQVRTLVCFKKDAPAVFVIGCAKACFSCGPADASRVVQVVSSCRLVPRNVVCIALGSRGLL